MTTSPTTKKTKEGEEEEEEEDLEEEEEMDEPERDGVPETEGTTGERKCDRRREDVSRRDARVDGEEDDDDDDASERDFWCYAADEKRRSEKGDE